MHPLLHCGALLDATFEQYLVRFRAGRRGSETVWARGEQIHRWREQGYTYLQIALKLDWDRTALKFTNSAKATALVHRAYRDGWQVPGLG